MKKILSVLLIILLLFPSAVAARTEQTAIKSDLISAIGLLENSESGFQSDKYVTNFELVRAVCIIADMQIGEYAENAARLKANGLTGDIGGEKEAARADDLIRASVGLLGYKSENYKQAASEAGLFKNASFKGRYITRAEFVSFVYNVLAAEKFTLDSFAGDSVTLSKKGNILEDRFKIKRVVGIVTADETAALYGEQLCRVKGEMKIGGVTARTDKNTKDFLGRRVEAFLKFDDNSERDAELTAICKYKNTEYKAVSEYIDGATTNSRLVWVDYRTGNRNKKVLPPETEVVWNGEKKGNAGSLQNSVFTPSDGEVTLIDNDGDGKIDVAMVWSYHVYTSETVSFENELIYGKSGDCVDLKNKDCLIYDGGGNEISLSDIKEFDVLSVAFAESGDRIYIVRASEKTVSGTYKRIGYSVLIGKDEYSLGAYCALNNVSDGDYVKAYLDMYNRAAYIVRQSKYKYGYLTKAYYDDIDEKVYVKMYTFDEGVKKLCFAEKTTVQNELGKEKFGAGAGSAENLYNSVKNKNELVKYRENTEGLINTILFATSKIGCDAENSTDDFEAYYGISTGASIESREAKFLRDMFVSSYFVGENTKILSLEGNPNNPEKFRQLSASDLISDNDYYVKIYDVDKKYEAGIVVIDKVEDWYVQLGSIVESVSETVDENGEECIEISVFNQGEKKIILADDKNLTSDGYVADKFYNRGTKICEIKAGDVIFYNETGDGRLASFAVIYKNKPLSEQSFYHTSNYGWGSNYIPNAGMSMAYCKVTKRLSNMIVADIDGARPIKKDDRSNCYICEGGRLFKAAFSDIGAGDRIVGLWKWSNLNDIIIYR